MNLNTEIINSFNKHADDYDHCAKIQHEIGMRLIERLDYIKITPQYILDLGCGTGKLTRLIQKKYPKSQVIAVDFAYNMLLQAKRKQGWFRQWSLVNGDMMALPFADSAFDLVIANQVIHWADSIPLVFREINRVMAPRGCLMFSTLGPDTFKELKQAWATVDAFQHTNRFIDMHDIGDMLLGEYFLEPVVDMEQLTIHYHAIQALLTSLKKQGVRNIHQQRNHGLTGKKRLAAFKQAYEAFCTDDGKCPLTYEAVYGHAWKGEQRRSVHGTETAIPINQIRHNKPPTPLTENQQSQS